LWGNEHNDGLVVVLLDSSENLHLVNSEYNEEWDNSIVHNRLDTALNEWDVTEQVLDGTDFYWNDCIATIDALDRVHVLYYGYPQNSTVYNDNLYHIIRSTVWGSAARVFPSIEDDTGWPLRADADSLGNIHMVCTHRDRTSLALNMYYGKYTNSWSLDLLANDGSKSYDIVADAEDNIHVVYFDPDWMYIRYMKKTGVSWSSPVDAVTDPNYDFDYAHLGVPYDSDLIRIFYTDYSGWNDAVKCVERVGGTWGTPYFISDPEFVDTDTTCTNTFYPPLGTNAPASGYYLVVQGYDNYVDWNDVAYFVYSDDLSFKRISPSGIITVSAISMSGVFVANEQYLGYIPASGLYASFAYADPVLLPGSVFAESLGLVTTIPRRTILTPTQELTPVVGPRITRHSLESFSIEKELDKIEEVSSPTNEGKNLRSLTAKSDRPIKFGKGDRSVNFYTRYNQNPVVFYSEYTLTVLGKVLGFVISNIADTVYASISSVLLMMKQATQEVTLSKANEITTLTIAKSSSENEILSASGSIQPQEYMPENTPPPSGTIESFNSGVTMTPASSATITSTLTVEVT